jgi:hypothetical protein
MRSARLFCTAAGIPSVLSFALGLFAVTASSNADAHIKLTSPPSWLVEDDLGGPDQKTPPCGTAAEDNESGIVTTFTAGETIDVEWQETVGHPGFFRIAVAEDRDDLVDPPVVTSNGDGVSGQSISATVEEPDLPVLESGLFPRETVSGAQAAPFRTTVTLPDTACESCTLQVIQFMSQHGPGYFYHHCANIRIVAAGDDGAAGAAGSSSTGAAGSSSTGAAGSSATGAPSNDLGSDVDDDDGGCSLAAGQAGRSPFAAAAFALAGIGAVMARRRSGR